MTLVQVLAAEAEIRHKLCLPNACMKVLHFNVLTSCPIDEAHGSRDEAHELHQWFIGLYGEHIIPAIVPFYTRDHAGAAMFKFMRSTPDCGTLAGPSLEWLAFRSPRPNGFAESPGLKRPGVLGRPEMPGSCQL
jgi:hypothetical protein